MKNTTRTVVAGLAAGLVSACAAGGPAQQRETVTPENGARLWRAKCGMCHNARPASEFDASQWPVIVAHMRTHAELTRSEADAIAAFLTDAGVN